MPWYCKDGARVLKVQPDAGDAVLFFNYVPGQTPESPAVQDPAAVHAGCPPLEGTKIIATSWIRSSRFDLMEPPRVGVQGVLSD